MEINYCSKGQRQRQKLDIDTLTQTLNSTHLTKDEKRSIKMIKLEKKYFLKIVNHINKAISNNKKKIVFFYNYYDFVNDRIGKPHGLLNEFLQEMCYDYSQFIKKDDNDIPITFKSLFGVNFNWKIFGRDSIELSW
jgi:hypothetical protein